MEKTLRAYKYRLYPNATQNERLDFMLWQGRKIYNGALEMWQECREVNGADPDAYELRDYWCAQRYVEPDTLGVLPAKTVEDLIRRLKKAYDNAYARYERGDFSTRRDGSKNYGFPRFKNRRTFTSLGFLPVKQPVRPTSEGWAKLYLTNVGDIRLRYHRDLPNGARPKMIVISRDKAGAWWATLQLEMDAPEPAPHPGPAVGVDIGLVYALALSDGTTVEQPKWYRDAQRDRRVIMRKLDRQRRANNPQNYNADGTVKPNAVIWRKSTRQRATERRLQKLDATITQQRWYWWHTITDWLTKTYRLIAIEDLTLDFMIKNKRLAMSTHDASFGQFWLMLAYKAAARGVEIVRVPSAYTSQVCAECGYVDSENRKTQANFRCVSCGHTENADINAARNILRVALNGAVQAPRGEIEAVGSEMPCEALSEATLAAR